MKTNLKCYISASSDFDLTKLESILSHLKIEYHSFYDFSIGTTFSDLIKRKLRESDFIIAVLENENSNVLFELGVAEGLGKPTFIIVEKELKIPFFLQNKLYFQTNLKDTKLMELALSNFIVDIKGKKIKTVNRKQKKEFLSINETNELIIQIKRLRTASNEFDIFNLIKETFSKLNVQNASITAAPIEKGADLIIRSNELSPYFGNPILVEIKSGNLNSNALIQTQERLLNYIKKSDAKGGIILYLDRNNRRYDSEISNYPSILSIDLEDFILGIASEGLEKFLIKRRNEIAHGIRK
jgi:hypothetical protein